MSELYTGDYAPELFNEKKRYKILQAQEFSTLTDAELRDMHQISDTQTRRFIQTEIGDCCIDLGYKIMESSGSKVNDFKITGGDGSLDNPGTAYLKGNRLFLRGSINYKDQTVTASLEDDAYTKTVLPALTTPVGSTYALNDIDISGDFLGACGVHGTVVDSTNFGRQWSQPSTGTTNVLNGISFGDSSTAYTVGANVMLKTPDRGMTWVDIKPFSLSGTTFQAVDFVNKNFGWAVGNDGTIVNTINGGIGWAVQGNGVTFEDLKSISAADASNAWITGTYGTMLHTSDSSTWVLQTTGITTDLNRVFAVDATVAFAVGDTGTILKTVNNGLVWSALTSGTVRNLNDLYFSNRLNGWVVGNSGTLNITTDGGSTWDSTRLDTTNDLKAVVFSDTTGFIADASGQIYRTFGNNVWEKFRTDYVYIDFHLAEVSGDATSGSEYFDPEINDTLVGFPNANRLRAAADIKVSEGWPCPSDYTSDASIQHYIMPLAKIYRPLNDSLIVQANITDLRRVVRTISEINALVTEVGIIGPQGETGLQGARGETGLQGAGFTGVQGATGAEGQTGAQGQTGLQGSQGETGIPGIQGDTGVQGETGVQGQTGLQGQTGIQGTQGSTGIVNFIMNNGAAILSTGIAGDITLPHNLIINDWRVFVEPTGTIDIELWKSDYANFPPTAATPMGDTGIGIYTGGLKNSGITDYWTTSTGAKDDIIRINIAGVTNATKLNLTLGYNFY